MLVLWAFSKAEMNNEPAFAASFLSFLSIAERKCFSKVFNRLVIARLRRYRALFLRMFLRAELELAILAKYVRVILSQWLFR